MKRKDVIIKITSLCMCICMCMSGVVLNVVQASNDGVSYLMYVDFENDKVSDGYADTLTLVGLFDETKYALSEAKDGQNGGVNKAILQKDGNRYLMMNEVGERGNRLKNDVPLTKSSFEDVFTIETDFLFGSETVKLGSDKTPSVKLRVKNLNDISLIWTGSGIKIDNVTIPAVADKFYTLRVEVTETVSGTKSTFKQDIYLDNQYIASSERTGDTPASTSAVGFNIYHYASQWGIDNIKIYNGKRPEVTEISPVDGSKNVAEGVVPFVKFNTVMDESTLNKNNIQVKELLSGRVVDYEGEATVAGGVTTYTLTGLQTEKDSRYIITVTNSVRATNGMAVKSVKSAYSSVTDYVLYENFEDDDVDSAVSSSNTIDSVEGSWTQDATKPLDFKISAESDGNRFLEINEATNGSLITFTPFAKATGLYSFEFKLKNFDDSVRNTGVEFSLFAGGTGEEAVRFVAATNGNGNLNLYIVQAKEGTGNKLLSVIPANQWKTIRIISSRVQSVDGSDKDIMDIYFEDEKVWSINYKNSQINRFMLRSSGNNAHWGVDDIKIFNETTGLNVRKAPVANQNADGIFFSWTGRNASDTDVNGYCIVGFYNAGRFVDAKLYPFTIPSNAKDIKIEDVATTSVSYTEAKVFNWDVNMQPLFESLPVQVISD